MSPGGELTDTLESEELVAKSPGPVVTDRRPSPLISRSILRLTTRECGCVVIIVILIFILLCK